MFSIKREELIIRLGDHNLESDDDGLKPVEYKVAEVTFHKKFNLKTYLNDIALLRIESTITFTRFIKPVCVPYEASFLTDQDISERKGIVTGWGKTSFRYNLEPQVIRTYTININYFSVREVADNDYSEVLREALVPILTNEACDRAIRSQNIVESFLCAGFNAGGVDACQVRAAQSTNTCLTGPHFFIRKSVSNTYAQRIGGTEWTLLFVIYDKQEPIHPASYDSGGPFVMPSDDGRMYCMGIVSYGIGCAEPGLPGVYTRVPKYLDWLRENMRVNNMGLRCYRGMEMKKGCRSICLACDEKLRKETGIERKETICFRNFICPKLHFNSRICKSGSQRVDSGVPRAYQEPTKTWNYYQYVGSLIKCSQAGEFILSVKCLQGKTITTKQSKTSRTTSKATKTKPKPISTSGGSVDLFPKDCGESARTSIRVVAGNEADIGAWPWMAAIYLITDGIPSFHCGGAVINNKYVVTAAHCMGFTNNMELLSILAVLPLGSCEAESVLPEKLIIRLGIINLESDDDGLKPVEYKVAKVTVHKHFNAKTFLNDIALLRIESTIKFTRFIKPVCVPYEARGKAFQSLLVRGMTDELSDEVCEFGKVTWKGDVLRETLLPIWTNEACGRVYKTQRQNIVGSFLCAGGEAAGGRDACQYDSGGPFVMPSDDGRLYLMGIVLYGFRCGVYPGVYTRVPKYLDWLRENMRQKPKHVTEHLESKT
ncbi:Proclotting enzyme [Nymphon striatum]|nr:Proclotting enzyme [Nymphon striatum]